MGSVKVVVPFVLAEGVQDMRLVPDERAVEQLVAAGLDPVPCHNSLNAVTWRFEGRVRLPGPWR
jgi:hypothetical protein